MWNARAKYKNDEAVTISADEAEPTPT
jgi:hypothetical protein